MKLVDILARELKAWPEGCSHIVQDHDGQCWPSAGDISASKIVYGKEWSTDDDGVLEFYSEIASDFGSAKVTRAEWQAAVDALNAPKVVEWDGVGLPPVGLDVEVMQGGLPSIAFDWETCKILAINIGSDEKPQVITRDFRGDAAIYYPGIESVYFRPIRTAEQVAAEEREAEDNEIMSRYLSLYDCEKGMLGRSPERVIIGLMRVMGYRKEPKPCGS